MSLMLLYDFLLMTFLSIHEFLLCLFNRLFDLLTNLD